MRPARDVPTTASIAVVVAALVLTLGCGGDNDASDDRGPTLSIIGNRVRMTCFGGDCFAGLFADSGLHLSVWRTVDGVRQERNEILRGTARIDVEVEMGGGNDVFRYYDRYTLGTLTVSMGGGDDVVDFDDGAATGTTRIDLGAGNDTLYSNASFPAQRFRIDAGPGDDHVELHHVPYPYANEVHGGDGMDFLRAPTTLAEHAQDIDGFETFDVFCLYVEDCPAAAVNEKDG